MPGEGMPSLIGRGGSSGKLRRTSHRDRVVRPTLATLNGQMHHHSACLGWSALPICTHTVKASLRLGSVLWDSQAQAEESGA